MPELAYDEIKVGDEASLSLTITEAQSWLMPGSPGM